MANNWIFWTGVVVTYAVNGIIFMKYNYKLEQKIITFHAYYTKVPDSAFPCETGNNLLKNILYLIQFWTNKEPYHTIIYSDTHVFQVKTTRENNKLPVWQKRKLVASEFNIRINIYFAFTSSWNLKTTEIVTLGDTVSELIQSVSFDLFI